MFLTATCEQTYLISLTYADYACTCTRLISGLLTCYPFSNEVHSYSHVLWVTSKGQKNLKSYRKYEEYKITYQNLIVGNLPRFINPKF
jgi:hypothetical protein